MGAEAHRGVRAGPGLRRPGVRPDGTFVGGASKTLAATVERVFDAFTDEAARARWLPELELSLRTARPGRSARFDVSDGTKVSVTLEAKGERCQVAVEHERLRTTEDAQEAKMAWSERLAALERALAGAKGGRTRTGPPGR